MPIFNPKPGNHYLTVTGIPVQVLEVQKENILVASLSSDNRFYLPKGYLLYPFKPEIAVRNIRRASYVLHLEKAKLSRLKGQKQLAPIIDSLLLEGTRTMRGLVREVKRRASSACKGKDVAANIRARIYWFKKKGYKQIKNPQGHIKVVISSK